MEQESQDIVLSTSSMDEIQQLRDHNTSFGEDVVLEVPADGISGRYFMTNGNGNGKRSYDVTPLRNSDERIQEEEQAIGFGNEDHDNIKEKPLKNYEKMLFSLVSG